MRSPSHQYALRVLGVVAWIAAYIGLWSQFGGWLASAVACATTALAGLVYWRHGAPPGRRGALAGMAAFAALFALGARWDAEPAPWYVRIAGALLFGVGLVLVAAESGNAIGACGGRPAGESTAMDGEPER